MISTMSFMRRRRWLLLALPFFLFILVQIFLLPRDDSIHLSQFATSATSSTRALVPGTKDDKIRAQIAAYWAELVDAFESPSAKPGIEALPVIPEIPLSQLEPDLPINHRVFQDGLPVTTQQTTELRRAHREFIPMAWTLGNKIPYKKGTKGIVMTAGGDYIGVALTAILMVRRTGSNLPIEIFLNTGKKSPYVNEVCERRLAKLNTKCLFMEDVWEASPNMQQQNKYQFKILAILYSSFQKTFLLDADAWPLHKPDRLFDSEPFKSHGLVTWPDHWLPSIAPSFFNITDTEPAPSDHWSYSVSSESGILMYNKATHGPSLVLSAYYNYYGNLAYYNLFSQGGPGQGDKETFRQAALVMQQPTYQIRTRCAFVGRFHDDGKFHGMGMGQADPREDWELQKNPRLLAQSTERWGKEDKLPDLPHARPMFMHHNAFKVDTFDLGHAVERMRMKKGDNYIRFWDARPQHFEEMVGYDAERELWQMILETDCDGTLLHIEHCSAVNKWFKEVFGERDLNPVKGL